MKYLKYIGLQVKSVLLWQLPVVSFSSLSLFGVDLCSSPSWISSSNSSEQGFRVPSSLLQLLLSTGVVCQCVLLTFFLPVHTLLCRHLECISHTLQTFYSL